MPPIPAPPDLDAVLAEVWHRLVAAVSDPASPMRSVSLATTAAGGGPDQRIVILRSADPAARLLTLHTDARSDKAAHLRARPAAAVLAWDPAARLQIRMLGTARLHCGDAVAGAAWDALSPLGRQLYRVREAPGRPIPDPSPQHFREHPEDVGRTVFTVVAVTLHRIETLRLTGHGQLRARFDWTGEACRAVWLVP